MPETWEGSQGLEGIQGQLGQTEPIRGCGTLGSVHTPRPYPKLSPRLRLKYFQGGSGAAGRRVPRGGCRCVGRTDQCLLLCGVRVNARGRHSPPPEPERPRPSLQRMLGAWAGGPGQPCSVLKTWTRQSPRRNRSSWEADSKCEHVSSRILGRGQQVQMPGGPEVRRELDFPRRQTALVQVRPMVASTSVGAASWRKRGEHPLSPG